MFTLKGIRLSNNDFPSNIFGLSSRCGITESPSRVSASKCIVQDDVFVQPSGIFESIGSNPSHINEKYRRYFYSFFKVNGNTHLCTKRIDLSLQGGFPSACLALNKQGIYIGPQGIRARLNAYRHISYGLSPVKSQAVCSTEASHYTDSYISVCCLEIRSFSSAVPNWLGEPRPEIIDLTHSDDEMDSDPPNGVAENRNMVSSDVKRKWLDFEFYSSDRNVDSEPKKQDRKTERYLKRRKHGQDGEIVVASEREKDIPCFLIHIKYTDEILIILFLENEGDLIRLEMHRIWDYIKSPSKTIKAIFHLSNVVLMKKKCYKEWIATLPGEQIVVDGTIGEGQGSDVGLLKVLERSLRLRATAPQLFPLPSSFGKAPTPEGVVFTSKFSFTTLTTNALEKPLPGEIIKARLLTQIVYREKGKRLEAQEVLSDVIDPDAFVEEILMCNSRLREIQKHNSASCLDLESPWQAYLQFFQPDLSTKEQKQLYRLNADLGSHLFSVVHYFQANRMDKTDPCLLKMAFEMDQSYVLFLGTGCAEPSSWRGTSAILLSICEGQEVILLDCGEGTYGQIVRYFGEDGARDMVDRVRVIWISHKHVDHCAGIPTLLEHRNPSATPLTIYCPISVSTMLSQMKVEAVMKRNRALEMDALKNKLRIDSWKAIYVEHSIEAYAIRINFQNGFSLVYSGDTKPCESLVREGDRCTLLIHEATHSDLHSRESQTTKHATWREALNVGKQMGAYRTILTHFSRRYPGLPHGLSASMLGQKAAIAFDGLRVRFADLEFLPAYNSGIEEALKEIEFGGDLISSDDESIIDLLSDVDGDEMVISNREA